MPDNLKSTMFWAFVLCITYAFVLSIVAYVHPGTDAARQMMNQNASGLITGALGFFAGRASKESTAVSTNPTVVTTTKTDQ